jgi:outer membrane protein assembly factor BamE (lipoprotein component of BamABCDE complex)
MRSLFIVLGCCLALAFTVGCTLISYKAQTGSPIGVHEAISIQNGVTTRQEVLSRLGSPNAVGKFEGAREKHFYVFNDVDSFTIALFGSYTTASEKARSLTVLYDENDVVAVHQYHTGHPLALSVPPFQPVE